MCAPVTTIIFFISTLSAEAEAVNCSPFFVIHHNSSVLKKINQNCKDSKKLQYCREISELDHDDIDNDNIQDILTACAQSGTHADYLVVYDISSNSCKVLPTRDNTRLSPDGIASIYLFQNCPDDHQQTNSQKDIDSTRIAVSVICMAIMVLLLSVYLGLMIHYRCFSCRNWIDFISFNVFKKQ